MPQSLLKNVKLQNTPTLTLGDFIKKRRRELRLSIRELARCLGVSHTFIYDIEIGRRFPSEAMMDGLAAMLSVHLEELKCRDSRLAIADLKNFIGVDPGLGVALNIVMRRVRSGEIQIKALIESLEDLNSAHRL